MPRVWFCVPWNAANAADVDAMALQSNAGGGVIVDTTDPWGLGGRRLTVQATGASSHRYRRLPCEDPGTEWTLDCGYYTSEGAGGFGQLVLTPTNSARNLHAHLRVHVPSGGPQNRRVQVYHGGTLLYEFPSGSSDTPRHYRLQVLEHASAGFIRVFAATVGESLDLVYDSGDRNTARAHAIDRIEFGAAAFVSHASRFLHVVGLREHAPTIARPRYFPVTSDVEPNEFVRSAGDADYDMLDERPHDGNGTTLAGSLGQKTRHGVSVSLPVGRTIVGVRPQLAARRENDGVVVPKVRVYSPANEDEATEDLDALAATHQVRLGTMLDDEPGGSGWTKEAADALEIEVEHATTES